MNAGRMVRILSEFYRTPWAVLPETLAMMQVILHRWADGEKLSAAEVNAAVGDTPQISAARREREKQAGGEMIAVLPIFGIMGHRAHLVEDVSSGVGTSTELVTRAFKSMVADPGVGAIVLDIDSPGGSVYGLEELSDAIHAARAVKPIVAIANSIAASAAYFVGSAAGEFVVTPGGVVGSIGTWGAHEDWSQYLDKKGVKVTVISEGKYKTEGSPYGPLSEEARVAIQDEVGKYYTQFVRHVARNRGDSPSAVRAGYGEGRMLVAEDAVKVKLADRVATFDQVIAELQSKLRGSGGAARNVATPYRAAAERDLKLLDLQG